MGRLVFSGYQQSEDDSFIEYTVWMGFFITSTDDDIGYEYLLKFRQEKQSKVNKLDQLLGNAKIMMINSIKGYTPGLYSDENNLDKKYSTVLYLENRQKEFKKTTDLDATVMELTSDFSEIVEYQLYGGRIRKQKYTEHLQKFFDSCPEFQLHNLTLEPQSNK